MTDANQHRFPLNKKGFMTLFSAVAIISSATGNNLVNAETLNTPKMVFSEDMGWMKSKSTLQDDNISIDFSNRFSSSLKEGVVQLETSSSNNIVSISVNALTLNLGIKGFGDSLIKVTAKDKDGNTVTDQFQVKIVKKGDINGDGVINPADVLQIYQVTSGKLTLTDEQLKLLDIDGDGKVTNADANELMKNYVGKKQGTTADHNYDVVLKEVNDAPTAKDDHYVVQEDETLTSQTSILENDFDVEGNTLTATKVTGPAHGSLTLNPDGTFTYVPDSNFNGTDQFTYKVSDGQSESQEQTVTLEVQGVNDAPVADAASLDVTEDQAAKGTLTASDVEGDALTYSLVENGKKGSVTITDPATGAYTYTPNANEHGKDSFSFKVNDGSADSNVVTVDVTIQAVNDAPVAAADHFSMDEDQTLTVGSGSSILVNDSDVDGDALNVTKISGPAHGSLTLNPDGTFTYVPDSNFNGIEQFTYKVSDGQADSQEQTVTIEVKAVNDAPVAKAASLEVTEDQAAQSALTASDVEGDALTYSLVEDGKKGSVTITDTKTGAYTYTPNANANGKDSFSFKVNDGTADSEVVTVEVTIQAVNDAPVAKADQYSVNEDETLTADSSILQNDSDVDGDTLTAVLVSGPSHGSSFTLNSDGTFTYVPDANFNGTDQFTYYVTDGSLASENQTVTIDVKAVNDLPVAKAASLEVTEDQAAQGTLSADDVEGDPLTYIVVEDGKKGKVTITDQATGAYTYTPNANENGTDSFSFKVNDGTGDSETVTVDVTIQAINDAPVVSGVGIDGKLVVGETVKGVYTYSDVENDPEGASTFKWYRGTKQDGSDKEAIAGADSTEYTIQDADEGSYLFFEVAPAAAAGEQAGSAVTSAVSAKITGLTPVLTLGLDPYRADPTAPITENELKSLGGTTVMLTLSNDSFKDELSADDFVLNNAPQGTTILSAMVMDSKVWLFLDYDGTDFDSDIPNFSVTAKASATLKGKEVTSNVMTIFASQDAPTALISEYVQGNGDYRDALEIYMPEGASASGLTLDVHQWNLATGQKRIISTPLLAGAFSPNMTFNIIHPYFYDAMDIMPIWYYNEEVQLTMPGYTTNAIVLKKDGKAIDSIGDPSYNGAKPIFSNGGTMVRKSALKDGLSTYDPNQWTNYPTGTYQFFGRYN